MPKQMSVFPTMPEEEDGLEHAHDNLEFDYAEPQPGGDLIVHVHCRDCGKSGSIVIESYEILW